MMRHGGAACVCRAGTLVISVLVGGCEEGDGLPAPAQSMDAGSETPLDAEVEQGSVPDARQPELAIDASFCTPAAPPPSECAPPAPPSVACGTLTCSGATPRCCTHNPGADAGPSCVAATAECTGGDPFGGNIVSTCDDAADCQPGEVCRDSYNKGLNINSGARCIARCSAGDPQYRPGFDYQVCTQSCECGAGLLCIQKRCAPPP